MQANGGSASTSYGGGGGRIAVRCLYNHYFGTCSASNGAGYVNGQAGTVYWRIHAPGTVISIR